MRNILINSHNHSFKVSIKSITNNLNTTKQYGLMTKYKMLQKVARLHCKAVVNSSLKVKSSENSTA